MVFGCRHAFITFEPWCRRGWFESNCAFPRPHRLMERHRPVEANNAGSSPAVAANATIVQAVRTSDFQFGDVGSSPAGGTKYGE